MADPPGAREREREGVTVEPTNRIDLNDPRANVYGVFPCPKCGGTHRWPTRPDHRTHPNVIVCDDCGLIEPLGPDVTGEGG